jgi:hypothetical protein
MFGIGIGVGVGRQRFGGGFVGLLDIYSGAAAAYSLRKLRTAYTGSAIEVRRTNNDVADIGFTSTGALDTAALLAFTGTGALDNGFVTKWYDQSGNANNATQSTALNQPQIVSSGSVILENGNPSIQFDGSNDRFLTDDYIAQLSLNNVSLFCVSSQSTLSVNNSRVISESDIAGMSSQFIFGGGGTPSGSILWVNTTVFGTMLTGQSLAGFIYNGTNFQAYVQGSASGASGSATINPETDNTTFIGCDIGQLFFMNGKIQEIISYKSNQITNLSGINTNINDFYSIY